MHKEKINEEKQKQEKNRVYTFQVQEVIKLITVLSLDYNNVKCLTFRVDFRTDSHFF